MHSRLDLSLIHPSIKTFTDKEQYEGIISDIPLQQAEVPDDVAGTVLHFVSGLGKWVTGQVAEINGGAWVCIEAMDVIMTKTDLQMPRQSRPACKYTRSHLGKSTCAVHVLQPAEIDHQVIEKEITANPTSAKPDWIIRQTQYALSLSPSEAAKNSSYFVILNLADYTVRSESAERGMIASLAVDDVRGRIALSL